MSGTNNGRGRQRKEGYNQKQIKKYWERYQDPKSSAERKADAETDLLDLLEPVRYHYLGKCYKVYLKGHIKYGEEDISETWCLSVIADDLKRIFDKKSYDEIKEADGKTLVEFLNSECRMIRTDLKREIEKKAGLTKYYSQYLLYLEKQGCNVWTTPIGQLIEVTGKYDNSHKGSGNQNPVRLIYKVRRILASTEKQKNESTYLDEIITEVDLEKIKKKDRIISKIRKIELNDDLAALVDVWLLQSRNVKHDIRFLQKNGTERIIKQSRQKVARLRMIVEDEIRHI